MAPKPPPIVIGTPPDTAPIYRRVNHSGWYWIECDTEFLRTGNPVDYSIVIQREQEMATEGLAVPRVEITECARFAMVVWLRDGDLVWFDGLLTGEDAAIIQVTLVEPDIDKKPDFYMLAPNR